MQNVDNIKKLCLGTVQFGLDYGINNPVGKPSELNVMKMIDYALESGIRDFDTAIAYGDAQRLLGRYIPDQSDIRIYTKIPPNMLQNNAFANKKFIIDEVKRSLELFRRGVIEGLYLHSVDDIYKDGVIEGLLECKVSGMVRMVGVSGYDSKPIIESITNYDIDMFQMPYNILDQRLDTEVLAETNAKCMIFARSAFLQGLLLMEKRSIPKSIKRAGNYLDKFKEIISRYDMDPISACLAFVLSNPALDYLVFGVDNLDQLKKNIDIAQNRVMPMACRREIEDYFIDIDKKIIFPYMW